MATNGTRESLEPIEFPGFEEPLELMCPFCRKEVTAGEGSLRIVTIATEAGWRGEQDAPQQSFGCHRECLDGVLGEYVPIR
jgi:hypothetical protein